MIKMNINNVATFKENVEIELKKVNYFYGANGTGKTTISNVIADDENKYTSSSINYSLDEDKYSKFVYNKAFVEKHFDVKSKIKGIYTLGVDNVNLLEEIEVLEEELSKLNDKKQTLTNAIDSINENVNEQHNNFIDHCWTFKPLIVDKFNVLFEGKRQKNSLTKFCLEDKSGAVNHDVDELLEKYNQLYEQEVIIIDELLYESLSLDYNKIENIGLLKEQIVGNEDSYLAKLIDKLDNEDWVNRGLAFLEKEEESCPFCQQTMEKSIVNALKDFFNKEYEDNIKKINNLLNVVKYKQEENITYLNQVLINYSDLIDEPKFNLAISNLENIYNLNYNVIKEKLDKPSLSMELYDISKELKEVNDLLYALNEKIKSNNNTFNNIKTEKETLTKNVYQYLHYSVNRSNRLTDYNRMKRSTNQEVATKKETLKETTSKIESKSKTIENKKSQISGIESKIDEINNMLSLYGFTNFKLQKYDDDHYKVIRNDGTDVGSSLSEGEERFISFLYFYHSIDSDDSSNKIIVIDDPISSLDNNITFIVSELTKNLINKCMSNEIRQIIILTHNIRYFTEVSNVNHFRRVNLNKDKRSYFIVRKRSDISEVIEEENNPIKNSYQLLWKHVKDNDDITVMNSLRRILETYYGLIADKGYKSLLEEMNEEEKTIYNSLINTLHVHSHEIIDEQYDILNEGIIITAKDIFKKIFSLTDQMNHYNLMMGEESDS